MSINSKSLEQYLLKRYENDTRVKRCYDGVVVSDAVVQEILRFGYKTIRDIEKGFNNHMELMSYERDRTYVGILRDLMILENCERYFAKAYMGGWQITEFDTVEFWKENGAVDIEKYLRSYNISIGVEEVDEDEEI